MSDIFDKPEKKKPGRPKKEVDPDKEKPKRKMSQKQLDALAAGRAKRAEKARQKKLNDDLEKAAVVLKKEQRAVAKNLTKEQNILEQIRIREREEKQRSDIQVRQAKWENARIHALGKCKSVTEFEVASKLLDKVEYDDFKNDDGIKNRFEKYIKKLETPKKKDGDGGDPKEVRQC